ncbi:hypothetical protein CPT03_04825 [Pedobacter ginsengisoli]|uniref:Uncharacterized protein n=1 Tax=Pedobacter ginsengisoli TaxID=363852 RepID=A0A2D1U2J0_9SPHI|nr:DUF4091 domain-containing protein [Pedobacter ginsengisoli]ATP55837.1 hypothetical protein CPT03_04825 [Pedobacter ginsengisoli]
MKFSLFILTLLTAATVNAQDASLALQKNPKLSTEAVASKWTKVPDGLNVSFATSNQRFAKELPPVVAIKNSWTFSTWKGETVNTQLLLWTKDAAEVSLELSDLKSAEGNTIKKENLSTGFIKYVITDEFRDGCGYRKPTDFDSSYVADLIDTKTKVVTITPNSTQPVWLAIKVPQQVKAGTYKGSVTIKGAKAKTQEISIRVIDKTLPAPSQWAYDLDLWQHPAAIARVHKVQLWSDRHFALMKDYYKMLANAGQKTITTSIVNEPWGHQTYDDYPSLIKWTKKKDGTWSYDYSLFDKYIAFTMSCGINQRINCYSMVPWKIAFTYFDESTNKEAVFTEAIGTPAYNVFWGTMLKDFTRHLKQKNWFTKTYIAMDERPMPDMKSVIALLKSIDSKWKIALAGEYHEEIEKDVFNYCIASKWEYPAEVLKNRHAEGKISTWYTCCTEPYPNAFTFSSPAEQVWMGWYTANKNMDGYLRWAYNSWTKSPLTDSRFTAWPAGDTYLVYPGPFSSVRFEKMIEGAQDFEKIRLLRKEYSAKNQTEKLQQLENALKQFELGNLPKTTAAETLSKTQEILNN